MVDNYKKFHQTFKSISHNFVYDRKNDEKLKAFYCRRMPGGKDKKKESPLLCKIFDDEKY